MKFLNKLFKKEKETEIIEDKIINIPDLMEASTQNIDLMAADPILEEIESIKADKIPEIIENLQIEKQLLDDVEKEKVQVLKEDINIPDAFNMSPSSEEEILIETLKTESNNFQKTQKFCKECGTPNDILNKFCVSCGYVFK